MRNQLSPIPTDEMTHHDNPNELLYSIKRKDLDPDINKLLDLNYLLKIKRNY